MKRLALLLGSLLVVSAAASAKEVVPAPVVVEEAPVQIVEKEVIVYRDKEEGFRPNGNVQLEYRYYGDTEGQNNTTNPESWNKNNNYSRIELLGNINMTENQKLEYRVRNYNSLNETYDAGSKENDTETRLRYFYDHGYLGDSKVNFTSRVEYEKAGDQQVSYQARFNFAEYMFDNDYVKTTDFTIAPYYEYTWGADNSSDYDNEVGLYFNMAHDLPFGFGTQLEVDTLGFHSYGNDKYFGVIDGKHPSDSNTDLAVNFYITQNTVLYQTEKVTVDFWVEAGYDSLTWTDKHADGTDAVNYELKADPQIRLFYQATPNVQLFTLAGAEYRNWKVTSESEASHWRWQPFAAAGFNVAF